MSEYAERDIIEQGYYYSRHTSAMTAEDLHRKSDIAAELAHRDMQIDQLKAANRDLQDWFDDARATAEQARARVARLFSAIVEFQRLAWRALDADYIDKHVERSMSELLPQAARITGEVDPDDIDPSPFVLRKQAEAVEAMAKRLQEAADKADEGPDESDTACTLIIAKSVALKEAYRLRQQADEVDGKQQ